MRTNWGIVGDSPRRLITALSVFLGLAASPLAGTSSWAASAAPVVFDARIVGDGNRTRFIADLTAEAEAAVFTLADPYRIVVDLSEVRFRFSEEAAPDMRGLFTAFRYGLISPGKSRMVLDVTGPVRVDKSFVVPPADDQPARFVIDVVPTDRDAFLAANRAYRESLGVKNAAKRDRALVTPTDNDLPTIVLDPGHGGIDTGAKGRQGAVEKKVTLAFAEILGEKLTESGRYNVLFTRTDDSFVALSDRVGFAQDHNADLFVSIHANSFRG
ncbi:MAG: N-acetylmuramoyl-L-alanine amidase, partial [Hyphomicrobiales bacterium]|nr:N-acetylmuramoyl-L-alanine amidase [Hyphomicrobiales bacterium]